MDYAASEQQGKCLPPQPARTFDGIGSALERVRASSDQVERMLRRVAPRDYPDGGVLGTAMNNTLNKPPYSTSLEQLEAALNTLGKSLDELEQHI